MNVLKEGQFFSPYKTFKGIFIPFSILEIKELHIMAKVVYGVLLYHARSKGYCKETKQQTLAGFIGISRNQLNLHLNTLEKHKLIYREKPKGVEYQKHKTTCYYFYWHNSFKEHLRTDENNTSGCNMDITPNGCNMDITPNNKGIEGRTEHSFLKNKKECNDPKEPGHRSFRQEIITRDIPLDGLDPCRGKETKKDIHCPKVIKQFLDIWNKYPVRKHLKQNTIAYTKAVDDLRRLIRGNFFDGLPVDNKFKKRKFTLEEFELSISRFSKMITNILYYPKNKKFFKSMSVSDFLFLHTSIEAKSQFLFSLEHEPKFIEVDINPKLTSAIIKVFQSTIGTNYTSSLQQMDKFMMSSRRLNKYFNDNKRRLDGRFYDDKRKANVLIQSVLFDVGDKAITPGWLCSNETFNRRLPNYCEEHVWVRR